MATNDNKPPREKPLHGHNFPTPERQAKGDMEIYTPEGRTHATAKKRFPHPVDHLVKIGTLDETHKYSSEALIELHRKAENALAMKVPGLEPSPRVQFAKTYEMLMLGSMDAADKFNYIMRLMAGANLQNWLLIRAICIDEITSGQACFDVGIRDKNRHREFVLNAFELLTDAVDTMRSHFANVEKSIA